MQTYPWSSLSLIRHRCGLVSLSLASKRPATGFVYIRVHVMDRVLQYSHSSVLSFVIVILISLSQVDCDISHMLYGLKVCRLARA